MTFAYLLHLEETFLLPELSILLSLKQQDRHYMIASLKGSIFLKRANNVFIFPLSVCATSAPLEFKNLHLNEVNLNELI